MVRCGRIVVLLLALAVLYAGPVAACVCADDLPMAEMPCCPDQPADPSGLGLSAEVAPACASMAASFLTVGEQALPAFVAIAEMPPAQRPRGPPLISVRSWTEPFTHPPPYLVTRRLRI